MGVWDGVASGAATGSVAGPWGSVIGAGIGLFGSLFGAHQQSKAQNQAAQIEAAAQKYAADLQAKGQADALAFTKGQAENAYLNSEVARQGNYDQWAAGQRRLGSVGALIGMGDREIPAYRGGVDPNFGGAPAGMAPGGPAPASSGDPILDALNANYAALGVKATGPGSGPTDIAYMANKIKETGGLTADNNTYWFGPGGRIAQELTKARGGSPNASPSPVKAMGSYFQPTPFAPTPIAPGVSMPSLGSVGSYF
jgi:hypothetical protein